MNEIAIPSKDDEGQLFRQVLGHYDVPSYIRRARAVEEGWQRLLAQCLCKRDEMLVFVRLHLATLKAQAGTWEALQPLVPAGGLERLQELKRELQPRLRIEIGAVKSQRVLRATLQELRESVASFNRRWHAFLSQVDLGEINRLRENYNKYYILEKECALRSNRLARQGFKRLAPLTVADLVAELPECQSA